MNEHGMRNLMSSKFQLGADAAAAAGPVGRHADASTDWKLRAEVLSYSRSRGLFAGISLKGNTLRQDKDDTRLFYGRMVPFRTSLAGHPNVAEFLLRYGADANARSRNPLSVAPLHSATANVLKLKTVEWLLEYKADVNAVQPGGWIPLHAAAARGDHEIVELLVSQGADPNRANDKGQTPLDLAKEKGHQQVVAALQARA
jgi:hypothetical protein